MIASAGPGSAWGPHAPPRLPAFSGFLPRPSEVQSVTWRVRVVPGGARGRPVRRGARRPRPGAGGRRRAFSCVGGRLSLTPPLGPGGVPGSLGGAVVVPRPERAVAPGVLAAAGPSQPAQEGVPGRGHLLAIWLIDLGGKPSARLSVFVIHGSKSSWETVIETRLCNDFSK